MINIYKDKFIGVLGMARSGIAAANLAGKLGANVLISDVKSERECSQYISQLYKGIEFECGGHTDRLFSADIIVKSPGVPEHIPILESIRKLRIPVVSEIEFVSNVSKPKLTVAITGTNGKTTTTTLAGELFKKAGKPVVVAGNIGLPPAAAFKLISKRTNLVLELSSYQLEDSYSFHPNIAALLNITPDHLEHHHTMGNYIKAKARIFFNQTKNDWAVLNYDDRRTRALAAKTKARIVFFSTKKSLKNGVYYSDGRIFSSIPGHKFSISAKLRIPGIHNVENALCAVAIGTAAGLSGRVLEKVITSFKGVEHRIEFVRNINGVKYINDSKATNVDSTLVALRSLSSPVILILGGRDKGAPYKPLRAEILKKVKAILLIGEASKKIAEELDGAADFYFCNTMRNAVKKAKLISINGDTVLLSPACASFDQFNDYEDRGRQFKSLVYSK